MISFLAALPLFLAPVAPVQNQDGVVPPIQDLGESWKISFDESEEGMTLEQFVKSCQQTTGLNFVISKQSAQALAQERVRMFGTKRIPKSEFYSFFQIIMFIRNRSLDQGFLTFTWVIGIVMMISGDGHHLKSNINMDMTTKGR